MKRLLILALVMLNFHSKAQEFEQLSEINNLYFCLYANKHLMGEEHKAIYSDLYLEDSVIYKYFVVLHKLPILDSLNNATLNMSAELYKSLYSEEDCKFLAEKTYQGINFLNSIADEYSLQKAIKYGTVTKALDKDLTTEESLEMINIKKELLKSITRRRELWNRYEIDELYEYLEKSLILKQCYNP